MTQGRVFNPPNKEARTAARWLRHLGFQYVGNTGSDHPRFEHPVYGPIDIPSSPSAESLKPMLREVAHRMGTTKPALERRLGIRQPKRTGPKIRRRRNEEGRRGRVIQLHRDDPPEEPRRIGTPQQRLAQLRAEQDEAKARLRLATPGTPAYRCALDDATRLRTEAFTVREELEREAAA